MKNWQSHKLKKLKSLLKSESYDMIENQIECFDVLRQLNLTEQEITNLKQIHRFKMFRWWIVQKVLDRGDCFGEAAFESLRHSEKYRREEMETTQRTGLAVLSKTDYFRVLKKAQAKNSVNKKDFIQKIPLFKQITNVQAASLLHTSSEEKCSLNQYVYQQGKIASHLYVVLEGEFEMLRQ